MWLLWRVKQKQLWGPKVWLVALRDLLAELVLQWLRNCPYLRQQKQQLRYAEWLRLAWQ